MKKVFFAILLAACFVIPALAQDTATKAIWDHGDNVSPLTYRTVNVYKVYDQKDSYIVLYEKQGIKIGKVCVPKSWGRLGENHKLFFRNSDKTTGSSMTVYYKGNDIYKVILTLPVYKGDKIYGIAPNGMDISADPNPTTLNIEY